MTDIVVIGSANMDLVVGAERLPAPGETLLGTRFETFLGGKGGNQAVAAARAGGRVSFVGRVGDDAFGARLRTGLADAGVATEQLTSVAGPSGVALIVIAPDGENMIVVAPGANGTLDAEAIQGDMLAGARLVLAQLETPLGGVVHAAALARAAGATFILDPAPARPLPRELLEQVDWLTPNETEARVLLGLDDEGAAPEDIIRALRVQGSSGVVLKRGAEGALLAAPGAAPVAVPAYAVDAVDTTAAGDAFNGAFSVALSEGAGPLDAACFAAAAAALSVTRRGAQPSLATRDEIDRFRTAAAGPSSTDRSFVGAQ